MSDSQPTPEAVRLHHLPDWWKARVRRATGCDRDSDFDVDLGMRDLSSGPSTIFDHFGSAEGGAVFVTEPYCLPGEESEVREAGERIAGRLGLEVAIVPERSTWHPPHTTRIEFRERKDARGCRSIQTRMVKP